MIYMCEFFLLCNYIPSLTFVVNNWSKNLHFPRVLTLTRADSSQIILMTSGSGVNISRMGNICLWLTLNRTLALSRPWSSSLSDTLNTNVDKVTVI